MPRTVKFSGLSASSLVNKDRNRKTNGVTDPFIRISGPDGTSVDSDEIRNTLDPTWSDVSLTLVIPDGTPATVRVEVFDYDWNSAGKGAGHDSCGHTDVDISAPQGSGTFALSGDGTADSKVSLTWETEAPPPGMRTVRFSEFSAKALVNRDKKHINKKAHGMTDPFIRITAPDGTSADTSEKRNTLDPTWDESLELNCIPAHSPATVRVQVFDFDWDSTGKGHDHDSCGYADVDITAPSGKGTFSLTGDGKDDSSVSLAWETTFAPPPPAPEEEAAPAVEEAAPPAHVEDLPTPKGPFTVFLHDESMYRPRMLFAGKLPVTVEVTQKIVDLKQQVLALGGIPVAEQELVLNGNLANEPAIQPHEKARLRQFQWNQFCDAPAKRLILENERLIGDYNIDEGVTLLLMDKPTYL